MQIKFCVLFFVLVLSVLFLFGCTSSAVCGNGLCETGEDSVTCVDDCGFNEMQATTNGANTVLGIGHANGANAAATGSGSGSGYNPYVGCCRKSFSDKVAECTPWAQEEMNGCINSGRMWESTKCENDPKCKPQYTCCDLRGVGGTCESNTEHFSC